MSTHVYNPTLIQKDWFDTQQAQRRSADRRTSKLFLPVLLFIVLLAQVWVRITILNSSYELEQIRQTLVSNDERLRAVRLDWSMKSSPNAIRIQAKRNLNMIPLTPQFIRTISESA